MRYLTRFNAAGGVADFWQEWKKPNPYRWPILGASVLMSALVLGWLSQEVYYYPPEQPEITYITTFAEGRTDEEIIQSNIENQRRKEERALELAEIEERRREIYKTIGAATGIDVDAMEAEAEAERAAAERAEQERLDRLFGDDADTSEGTADQAE